MIAGDCWLICRPGEDCYDYEDRVDELLTQNEYAYDVQNYGLGGEDTFEGLNRIDSVLNASCNENAEYILILEGTNDLTFSFLKDNILFNLSEMVERSIANGLIPLIATIPPDKTAGREYKDIPTMNALIKNMVEEKQAEGKNVILVDLYASLDPNWDDYLDPPSCYGLLNSSDKLHVNEIGQNAIGDLWYASLTQLLPLPPKPLSLGYLELLLNGN